jgi:hypothetical protein
VATFEPQAPTEHDLPDPIPAPFELEVYSLKGKLARVMSIRPDPADRPLLVVGRRATSDDCPSLTIREDGKLSSRHFLLSGSNKGLRIADLHSTNGTWLSITAEDDISVSSGESFLLISRERTVQLSLDTFDEETGEGRLTLIDDGNDEPRGMPFHLAEGQHLPLGEVMRARRSGDSVTGSNDMAREEESLLVRMHGRLAFLPPAHGIEEVFEGAGQVLFQRLDARGSGESIEPGRYVLAGNSLFRLVRPS